MQASTHGSPPSQVPVDLVIDHSVVVDEARTQGAFGVNATKEVRPTHRTTTKKLRIVTVGISGGSRAHAAVSRRAPVSLCTIVARTEGYTYAAKVWALFIVQGPFSVAPCETPNVTIRITCASCVCGAPVQFERNRERFEFLAWAEKAFKNLRVVPPGTGIVHQVCTQPRRAIAFLVMNVLSPGVLTQRPPTTLTRKRTGATAAG
jgi:hypothetical protein